MAGIPATSTIILSQTGIVHPPRNILQSMNIASSAKYTVDHERTGGAACRTADMIADSRVSCTARKKNVRCISAAAIFVPPQTAGGLIQGRTAVKSASNTRSSQAALCRRSNSQTQLRMFEVLAYRFKLSFLFGEKDSGARFSP